MGERVLTAAEARGVYDRIGKWQDTQAFYEDPAVREMIAHAALADARTVYEFGCGTGRLAARLLADALSCDARYMGVDVSPTMVRITRGRLRRWPDRAAVAVSDGTPHLPLPDRSIDRFIATYVLDILSGEDVAALIAEARRVLADDGLLCLVSLTDGERGFSRGISALWRRVFRLRPQLVGGCRPIRLRDSLSSEQWEIEHRAIVTAFVVPSEVVVAQPIRNP